MFAMIPPFPDTTAIVGVEPSPVAFPVNPFPAVNDAT